MATTVREINLAWGGDGNGIASAAPKTRSTKSAPSTFPCKFRDDTGPALGRATCAEGCKKGKDTFPIRACSKFGKCVIPKTTLEGIQCCRDCKVREEPDELSGLRRPIPQGRSDLSAVRGYSPASSSDLPVVSRTRVALPGHFNAGMCEFNGRTYLASRLWNSTCISELDENWQPLWTKRLILNHPDCTGHQEDARLYVHDGKLEVAFTGVWSNRKTFRVNQLYAILDDEFRATAIYCPKVVKPQSTGEKNWTFFSLDGNRYAVYSVGPEHTVLRIEGNEILETWTTPNALPWSGHNRRGSTPPVLCGDCFVSFFHGNRPVYRAPAPTDFYYTIGVYEFESVPPFRVIRQTPQPILSARHGEAHPERPHAHVIFPCGSIRRGDSWFVSQGTADQWVDVLEWSVSDIDKALGHDADRGVLDRPERERREGQIETASIMSGAADDTSVRGSENQSPDAAV